MIADTSPLGHIGPQSLPTNKQGNLRLNTDQQNDRLGTFFANLTWTDRQVLALHFAERLSPWEIHVVLNMSMSDVLCRIQRLRKIARESIQASRGCELTQLSLK
jgi:DNA-directed RNA polymerase specialized sigma24 family protein